MVTPRVLVSRYKTQQTLDRTERFLQMSFQSLGEMSVNKLDILGAEDTTLTSELGITGLSAVNKKHRSLVVTYSGARTLNETTSTSLQLSGSKQQYPDGRSFGLVNYDYGSALWNVDYKPTARATASLQALAGKFSVIDNSSLNTSNFGVNAGLSYLLGDRWRVSVVGGPSQVRSSQRIDHGSSYTVSVARRAESSTLTTSLSKVVIPTGGGLMTRSNVVRFDWNKTVNDRLTAVIAGSTTLNNNINPNSSVSLGSLRYREFSAGFNWLITQTLSINFLGSHSWQGQDDSLAKRNYAAFTIMWNGLDKRLN